MSEYPGCQDVGLPKMHKPDVPLRPIVSAIGSYTYNLAKFMSEILKPLSHSQYDVKDSFTFSSELLSVTSIPYMCSYDIVSLFTNIPINETIEISLDMLYKDTNLVHGLTRLQFKKLLIYCVKQNHFVFNGMYYDQVDGVAMGSPLGPILDNIFISQLENKAINKFTGNKPAIYKRYVDDCFLVFNDVDDSELFLEYMNNIHANIKFTVETEKDNHLSFLDVLITRTEDGLINTTLYRKPTFTGLYMRYDSFVPQNFKRSLIRGLFNRAWRICSSDELFQKEVGFIKDLLQCNGYPHNFIRKQLTKFLHNKQSEPKTESQLQDQPKFGPNKKDVFIVLPFCGNQSLKLQRQLERVLSKTAPYVNLVTIFKPVSRLSCLSKLKSTVSVLNRSNVIYKINCVECPEFYIGLTTRRLHKRLHEHKTREYCSVYRHSFVTDHKMDFDNPEILGSDIQKIRLQIKETLNIKQFAAYRSLNVNIKSYDCKLW